MLTKISISGTELKNYLKELRFRFYYSLLSLSLTSLTAFLETDLIFFEFTKPLKTIETNFESSFVFLQITEAFQVSIELSIIIGILLSLPFFWLQIWFFFAQTFYKTEQQNFNLLISFSMLSLYSTLYFCHTLLLPKAWEFLLSFGIFEGDQMLMDNFNYLPGLGSYLKLTIQIYFALVITSQFPLLIFLLLHWQWLSLNFLIQARSWLILLLLVWAAFITPPDLLSLLITFLPLYIFFETLIFFLICKDQC